MLGKDMLPSVERWKSVQAKETRIHEPRTGTVRSGTFPETRAGDDCAISPVCFGVSRLSF